MNKIQDYSVEMLKALQSVFWYEGLLTEDKTAEHFAYSKSCWLLMFIDDLRNNQSTKYSRMYTTEDIDKFNESHIFEEDSFDWQERHTVIWQILVEMFGECGTSPRTGWIEQRKECADFLETIVKLED